MIGAQVRLPAFIGTALTDGMVIFKRELDPRRFTGDSR
jgi:hypothetical protein